MTMTTTITIVFENTSVREVHLESYILTNSIKEPEMPVALKQYYYLHENRIPS